MTISVEEIERMSPQELRDTFAQLDASVHAAEPQVASMLQTALEAKMILDDLKHRRGRAAFLMTARRG